MLNTSCIRAMKRLLPLLLVTVALSASAHGQTESKSSFTLPSGVTVTITEAPFNKAKFTISGCFARAGACLINGHIPFGFDNALPETYVKSITVSFKGRSYALDASDMYDAWGKRPLEHKGVVRYFGGKCNELNLCRFRGLFSDAAGSFVAEWYVEDGKAFRTVLTNSEDILNLFEKHIDPPEDY
jgi:hypothetical protein